MKYLIKKVLNTRKNNFIFIFRVMFDFHEILKVFLQAKEASEYKLATLECLVHRHSWTISS